MHLKKVIFVTTVYHFYQVFLMSIAYLLINLMLRGEECFVSVAV